jgi:hypothetical protein
MASRTNNVIIPHATTDKKEAERVKKLRNYKLLDSPRESEFDSIT